jgi:hypothetical protein
MSAYRFSYCRHLLGNNKLCRNPSHNLVHFVFSFSSVKGWVFERRSERTIVCTVTVALVLHPF